MAMQTLPRFGSSVSPIAHQLPLTSLDRWMNASTKLLDPDRLPIDCPKPRSVESAQLPNREK